VPQACPADWLRHAVQSQRPTVKRAMFEGLNGGQGRDAAVAGPPVGCYPLYTHGEKTSNFAKLRFFHEQHGWVKLSPSTNDEDKVVSFRAQVDTDAADAFVRLSKSKVQEVARRRSLQLSSDRTEAVYHVSSGWLVASKSTEEGQRQIVDFVLPGEMFDPGSANAKQSSTDLTALTRAKVSIIPRSNWQELLQHHPGIQQIMNRHMAASYARIAERLLRVGKAHAEARIAYAICELCLRSTDMGIVEGSEFHLPVTQQILGEFVGLSSVHVSRTLRRLRRDNILSTGDHIDIVIKDVDRLADVAGVDLEDLRAEIIPAA